MVRRIYEHFDLELTPAAEAAMQRFLLANPKNKDGVHRYSLEEFGLDPDGGKTPLSILPGLFRPRTGKMMT